MRIAAILFFVFLAAPAQAICTADGELCCKLPQILNPETRRCEAMDACPAGTTRACLVPAVCTCQKRTTCAIRLVWTAEKPSDASIPDAPGHQCDRAGMELAIAAALARLLGGP